MNKAIARPAKLSAICAGLLMLIAAASAAHASSSDAAVDIVRAARTAASAEVYIVPNYFSHPVPLNLDEVQKYGCGYSIDRRSMSELLAIIDRAVIEKSDMHIWQPELRILIRLHNSDGHFATLAFERSTADDGRVHGVVNGVEASAAPDLPERLRAWVAGLAPPTHVTKYIRCP